MNYITKNVFSKIVGFLANTSKLKLEHLKIAFRENGHFQMPHPPLIFHLCKKFEFLFIV